MPKVTESKIQPVTITVLADRTGTPPWRSVTMQVNTMDRGGGAEQVALALHDAAQQRGCQSVLAVGRKLTDREDVIQLPRGRWWRSWNAVAQRWANYRSTRVFAKAMAEPTRVVNYLRGAEDFHFPGTRRLLGLTAHRPDLVHLHNLHGGYFDLRYLPQLSQSVPTMVTLHDAWLLAGHCAHSLDCDRWQTGCGNCPHLDLPMRVWRDRTAVNWQIKQAIYRRSKLYIATPSRWLMQKVQQSMLAEAIVEARVIPNGVDTEVFCPGDALEARRSLGLPIHAPILLFVGCDVRSNPWKDMPTAINALERLGARWPTHQPPPTLIALGQKTSRQRVGRSQLIGVPYTADIQRVAAYYRAADIYVHASRADTFPSAVLEAMACQTPVVATVVGGIPEQIEDGRTGMLVPSSDATALADAVYRLLTDKPMRQKMGEAGGVTVRRRYRLENAMDEYFRWYEALIADSRIVNSEAPPLGIPKSMPRTAPDERSCAT